MVRLAPLVLALLAVIALGAAAATLDASQSGGGPAGPGDGPGLGLPNQSATSPAVDDGQGGIPGWLLRSVMVMFGGIALLVLAGYLYREGWRGAVKLAVVALVLGAVIGLAIVAVENLEPPSRETNSSQMPAGPPNASAGGGGGDGGDPADDPQQPFDLPPVAVLGAVGLLAVLGAAALAGYRYTGDSRELEGDVDEDAVEAVGAAAGRAADRIEGAGTVENAVFRAWREMTDYLDLPRRTTTPGEFADAAVEAGMRPDDVRELTALFEASRYGGVDPDEAREQRAVDALRRIEREYAPDEPPTEFEQYDDVGRDAGAGAGGS